MDTEKSLYGSLCQFFTLISKPVSRQGFNNTHSWSCLIAPGVENEAKEKKRAIRNGFKTILSPLVNESELEISEELQLHTWLFKLSSRVSKTELVAIEKAISELEKSGKLHNFLPILKMLFNINPVKNHSLQKLQTINVESFCYKDVESHITKRKELKCVPYHLLPQNTFQVPVISYENGDMYTSTVITKLGCTRQFDDLDVAHRNLFGVLENPPKNLNYLGISKCTKLSLGIKSSADNNKPVVIQNQDEGYESPTSNDQLCSAPTSFSYWEDLENLCNSSKIRRTWEAKLSGQEYPVKELPYLSQAPLEVMEVVFRLYERNLHLVDQTLPIRDSYCIDETEFRKHLQYLLLGIESSAFVYENEEFRLDGYPFIKGISADCLAGLVQPLLECGLLVKRLNAIVWDPTFGPVRNALADQLQESLQFHQQLVNEVMEDRSFLAIVHQLKKLLPTLKLMDRLWNWPGWESGSGCGVSFLQHLVNLSTETADDQERSLLTAYFAACVDPFLTYLEHWLYRGNYCDPQNEFFIKADDEQLEKRDRNYWINGFAFQPINRTDSGPFINSTVEEDAIMGLLNDVYLCGKTVHLLQLCQAKELEHGEPSLRIGLSLSELNDIKSECEVYALRSPAAIIFVEPVKDISQQARKVREAKLAELVALKEAKQLDRAVKRSERHALAKAELDEQLDLKKAEVKKRENQEKLLEEDIRQYQDTIDKREATEKRRLIMKYARLLDDQDSLKDDASEDELNANEPEIMDEENNMVSVILPTQAPSTVTSLPLPSTVSIPPPTSNIKASPFSKKMPTQIRSSGQDRIRKSKAPLTREEIKTKVLWEEFGVDPRYTKDTETVSTVSLPITIPYVPKDWKRPSAVSYSNQFSFDVKTEPKLEIVEEKRNWLQEVNPSEEQIRDLSLSFFVQRSLLLPIRTQCQIVNRSLMKLLIGPEHRFMQHLEALRQFLFLDNGAFSRSLVVNIGRRLGHLTHVHQLINVPSMNFILQSALNAVHADDYHASRLSFYIKEASGNVSNSQLEALECFTLRYRVGWPLNLILTEEVMDDYSQIFSFVLQLRLAAWALEDVYIHLMKDISCRWHAVHIARHSLYHFVQSMQNYVMSQLLTLAWTEFLAELKKNAQSLDDLYEIHSNYVHRAKSRLLLTPKSASLMKIIRDALNLALKFRSLLLAANYQYTPHLQTQINAVSVKAREYAKFIRLILVKVNDRSHQSHLNELLVRLNFNDHYSS